MKQRQANDPTTLRDTVSDWWDDEWQAGEREIDALLADVDGVRSHTRDYDLIGSRLRGEPLVTRDLLDSINARLDEIPDAERPGGGKVVSLSTARNWQSRRVWQGAMAASLFAAVTAVGLTLSTGERSAVDVETPMQAEGETDNDRAVMASLNAQQLPEDASPAALAAKAQQSGVVQVSTAPSNGSKLPDWATGRSGAGPDPYVVTHYRMASPEFGTTGPEARATTFDRK
ncbi:hypothetical protein D5687_04625 [Guyparkeria sp. SCN-R1]|uniref:hypothetical protein n=1 Tax=Guyparkeria sp. SCN-R1 TaxID=2341113 RepID=UPI000F64B16A|nr:hypothetical protein [Guyparkeria sp. SCN-R1]RRQ24022.1 hypothetical protein D5687_04625 [Guyparkeria sp. SCN-R1]